MNDIFALADDLIQSIDTVRSIVNCTTTSTFPSFHEDSTIVEQHSDEEDEMKAGIFLVDECFSTMNASREKCRAQHLDVVEGNSTMLNFSGDKYGSGNQECRGKIKLDSDSTMIPCGYSNNNVLVIGKQSESRPNFRQYSEGASTRTVQLNDKETVESKCLHCNDTDNGDWKEEKDLKEKAKYDRLIVAAHNRLNREKKKKRAMIQPQTQISPLHVIQAKKPYVVKPMKIHTTAANTIIAPAPAMIATLSSTATTGVNSACLPLRNNSRSSNISDSNSSKLETEKIQRISTAKLEVNVDVDVNTIAYKCLEAFLKEVEEFQETVRHHRGQDDDNSENIMKQHGNSFASFIEEKYLRQSLDKLHPSTANDDDEDNHHPIVDKVKTLITRYIAKCRDSSSLSIVDISKQLCTVLKRHDGGDSSDRLRNNSSRQENNSKQQKRWTCAICGKINALTVGRNVCSTCGRRRGYQGKPDLRLEEQQKVAEAQLSEHPPLRPDKAEEEFLAKMSTNMRLAAAELPASSIEESQRKFYLHGKDDYEIDSRAKLLGDIRDILENVRLTV